MNLYALLHKYRVSFTWVILLNSQELFNILYLIVTFLKLFLIEISFSYLLKKTIKTKLKDFQIS